MLELKKNYKDSLVITSKYKEKDITTRQIEKAKRLEIKKKKALLRYRKSYRRLSTILNTKMIGSLSVSNFKQKITIRVTPNNIFCTLVHIADNKTLHVGSGGKYKIKTTRKKLKFNIKVFLRAFFKKIKLSLLPNLALRVGIIGPIKIRKTIVKLLPLYIKPTKDVVVYTDPKKCFNGCRPPKKRRKKQKGLRIFKQV